MIDYVALRVSPSTNKEYNRNASPIVMKKLWIVTLVRKSKPINHSNPLPESKPNEIIPNPIISERIEADLFRR